MRITKFCKTIAYLSARFLVVSIFIVSGCGQNGQFHLLDGNSYSLDDFEGKWVVVNFWAEWCTPCLEEVPALNRLAREGAEAGISVIGVSYDALENTQLKAVVNKWKLEYPVMATQPVPVLPFGLPAQLPTNYILNPQGEIVNKLVGQQDYHSLRNAIGQAKQSQK